MIIMDLKGGSWVGDMYHRLEAMCVEVEEVICEDTFKYVENQVRSVGDTVKKFYSEVLEDLRSPSSLDPVEEKDVFLSVVDNNDDAKPHNKQNADDETEPVDAASENLVEDCAGAGAGNKNYRCCSSVIYRVIKPCEPKTVTVSALDKYNEVNSKSNNTESTSSNQIIAAGEDLDCTNDSQNICVSDTTESTSLHQITAVEGDMDCREDSQDIFVSDNTDSTSLHQITAVEEDKDSREDYQSTSVSKSQFICSTVADNSDELLNNEIEEPSSAHGDVGVNEASKLSHKEDGGGISTEMVEGHECGEAVNEHKADMLSGENLSTDFNISSINSDLSTTCTSNLKNSIVDEELSIVDLGTPSPSLSWESRRYYSDKLGALVGEEFNKFNLEDSCVLVENYDHSSKSALSQRSYKKRIQDVFSTRRWSKSKRDQEVLAASYEEQFANLVSTIDIMQNKSQKSQISESFESDWELL